MSQFLSKADFFLLFRTDIAQKLILGQNFRDFSPELESAPPRYHVCQFSVETGNFEFFGLNLGQLPKYMRCFGSNNIAGVTERTGWMLKWAGWSWVEEEELGGGGWNWVEVGARVWHYPFFIYALVNPLYISS